MKGQRRGLHPNWTSIVIKKETSNKLDEIARKAEKKFGGRWSRNSIIIDLINRYKDKK